MDEPNEPQRAPGISGCKCLGRHPPIRVDRNCWATNSTGATRAIFSVEHLLDVSLMAQNCIYPP